MNISSSARGQSHSTSSLRASSGQAHSTDSGQALLPLVIVLVLLIGVLGATLAATGFLQTKLSGQRVSAEIARQAAYSGVNDALLRITRNKDWLNPSGYDVCFTSPCSSASIKATVTVTDDSRTTLQGEFAPTPEPIGTSGNHSLVLDASGYPVVSFRNGMGVNQLKLLHCND